MVVAPVPELADEVHQGFALSQGADVLFPQKFYDEFLMGSLSKWVRADPSRRSLVEGDLSHWLLLRAGAGSGGGGLKHDTLGDLMSWSAMMIRRRTSSMDLILEKGSIFHFLCPKLHRGRAYISNTSNLLVIILSDCAPVRLMEGCIRHVTCTRSCWVS